MSFLKLVMKIINSCSTLFGNWNLDPEILFEFSLMMFPKIELVDCVLSFLAQLKSDMYIETK